MMDNGWELTREERQQIYDGAADVLGNVATMALMHAATAPDCSGAPLCVGAEATIAISRAAARDPEFSTLAIIVAIRELGRARTREAALTDRLAVQRALTADIAKAMESADERETGLNAEIEHLNGIIYYLTNGGGRA